jgi:hypothetical protein
MSSFSFEAFNAWVLEQQGLALSQMKATTGEEFSRHADTFQSFSETLNTIYEFKKSFNEAPNGANNGA